jgi:hypothetical protein
VILGTRACSVLIVAPNTLSLFVLTRDSRFG